MASALHFMVLCILALQSIAAFSESNADRIAELLHWQSSSADGVIRMDDASMRRFSSTEDPRPYSLIIFFDAQQLRDNPELKLQELRREFGLAASAYIRHNKGRESGSKVFFCDLEFKQSQQSFSLFVVSTLPHIKHLPPGSGDSKEAAEMDHAEFARTAEGMVAFVESKTKQKCGSIERPPPVTRQQLLVFAGGLALAAPFVLKKLMAKDTPLHDPKVWCIGALIVYFFSVSGGMHNIIRRMPLFMADRNNPGKLIFFYQASGMQLGTEGFVVGFLYTIVGVMLAFVTHFAAAIRSKIAQRTVMLLVMAVAFWAVRKVIFLDNWKTGYWIHAFWPSRWK